MERAHGPPMFRTSAWLTLLLLSCGPEAVAPPVASVEQALVSDKSLAITWQGQQTGYWCGPGSTRIALTARTSNPPSQTTLASYMGTTTNGTNHIGLVAGALNHYLGTNVYVTRNISDPPGPGQQQALQNTIVGSISNGYAMVGNVVSGWRPPGYPGGTIYHYVAIVGFDQGGARVQIADPAGGCAVWCSVPRTYWVSISDLAVWIGGKGYAGTNLAPREDAPPTSGTLIGAIYQGGSTSNRVSGAVVTVAGRTATTGADGMYQFPLGAGSYTVSVSKAGYSSAQATRTVTAGAQTWGSMEINPAAATGVLRGKIYAVNPANAADLSMAISGATVRVGGQTFTTAADGMYVATLPPGTYVVQASKSGFTDASLSRAVTAGATTWGSVGLSTAAMPDTQPPQVAISFPQAGATLDTSALRLTGTASDDRGALSEVAISLNGGAVTSVPVSAGAFAIDVKLAAGENTVLVTARDAAGLEGRAERSVRFAAGLSGQVVLEDGTAQAGALVLLLDDAGAELQRATSDATGRFEFDVSRVPLEAVVTVSADGFRTAREAITLGDDRRGALKVTLLPGIDEGATSQGPGIPEPSAEPTPETTTAPTGCSTTGVSLGWLMLVMLRRRSVRA